MKKKIISDMTFDEERALYNLRCAEVKNCTFAGPADGESALKESRDIEVNNCRFSLRYPLWHSNGFLLCDSSMDEKTRAPIWYARHGKIKDCGIKSIKALRECRDIELCGSTIDSAEFGWNCTDIKISDCKISSEYFMLGSKNINISSMDMNGKYSFQYTKNLKISNSVLDTKDAFWHSVGATAEKCKIKGEYLGWYSKGLTLIDCEIIGTQPLCYCKDLTLINCTMKDTDLSFEYSDVNADIRGGIVSVKNPKSGKICADGIGEIIKEGSIIESRCEIEIRK